MAKKQVKCSSCQAWIESRDYRRVPSQGHKQSECSGANKLPADIKGFTFRVQCPDCLEMMTADLGPNKTPVHIRKGGVARCSGGKKFPKKLEVW